MTFHCVQKCPITAKGARCGRGESLESPPGREKFLAEVHKWVEEYGGKICTQMRRLGTSCDWSRQAYTMDPQLSAAVKEAFLRMHADGLIYRDVRLVNWDCLLQTAVSESEVRNTPSPDSCSLRCKVLASRRTGRTRTCFH